MTQQRIVNVSTVGVIIAAGAGTRLFPAGKVTSKALFCVYDKPAIYYPLTLMIEAGITKILLIVAKDNRKRYKKLLGDGSQFGISITYAVQYKQVGVADAYNIGHTFIGGSNVVLAFGDNVFVGEDFPRQLRRSLNKPHATVFAQAVDNPSSFGIVEVDEKGRAISIEEKPAHPKSNLALFGIYSHLSDAPAITKTLKKSNRGEYEITDVNNAYRMMDQLFVSIVDSHVRIHDIGTAESLLDAAIDVAHWQQKMDKLLGCPAAAAFLDGLITADQLMAYAQESKKTTYGKRLMKLATEGCW